MLSLRPFHLLSMTLLLAVAATTTTEAQDATQAEALLKKLDSNGDGVISPGEVPARTQLVLNRIKQQAGIEGSGSLTISKVVDRLKGDSDDDRGRGRDDDDRRRRYRRDRDRRRGDDDRRDSDSEPAVPGFGEEVAVVGPPGFGADADLALVALEDRYTEKVIDYAEKILDRYDRNKNGQLEGEEIKNGRWSSDPSESDLNDDGILTKGELAERIAKKYGGRKDDDDRNDDDDDDDDRDDDRRRGSSRNSDDSDRYRKYAEALIKQNDKNDNGVLEKEEWESVKVAHGADASKDGVVTAAELTAKLSGYGEKNSSSSSSERSSSRDSRDSRSRYSRYNRDRRDRDDDDDDEKSSTIRFLTATERLPRGLSDWFLKADQEGNNDGQVHLSEYGDSPSKFREYDLNNDGFVTPAECLEAAERRAR